MNAASSQSDLRRRDPGPASGALPRIALAQMTVLPGLPQRNVERMCELIEQARGRGSDIVVFSEMCVPGYIMGDAWEIDALVQDWASWSEDIREASGGLTVVFGNVVVATGTIGEDGRMRKYNCALICHDRSWVRRPALPPGLPDGAQPKTLHPNYRFFDDDRHFFGLRKLAQEQGREVFEWMVPFEVPTAQGRFRFGVQLCEDLWVQDYVYRGRVLDGIEVFHRAGAQAVFNLSASPWTWQKNAKRDRTIREVLSRSPLPLFYVNHVGAQNNGKNILVFDGDSCAYAPSGRIRMRAPAFAEHLAVIDDGPVAPGSDPGAGSGGEIETICTALRTGLAHLEQVRGTPSRFLIGVSGGIDSSVVACLLSLVVGSERVFAVNMPTRYNSPLTRDNARVLCDRLGIDQLVVPIGQLHEALAAVLRDARFEGSEGTYSRLVDENVQARIRGADVLAGLAAKHGLVFTNNGNKTEVALGYATLYGDVNGAIAPIADLYKDQVFDLARHLNERVFAREVIPLNLYDGSTVPSAELSEEQDITRGLGDPIKYGYHDALLRALIEYRRHPMDLMRWYLEGSLLSNLGWNDPRTFDGYFGDGESWMTDLEWVERQLRINVFKRIQGPPAIVLSKRAFGFDLRESQLPDYRPRAYARLRSRVSASRTYRERG